MKHCLEYLQFFQIMILKYYRYLLNCTDFKIGAVIGKMIVSIITIHIMKTTFIKYDIVFDPDVFTVYEFLMMIN